MNDLTKISIWAAVIVAVFAILWWQGHVRRLAEYWQETMEELKKCTWPSREELKGSTVVVMVTLALLAAFTVGIDFIVRELLHAILKIAS